MTTQTRNQITRPTRSAPILRTPSSGRTPETSRQAKLLIAGPIGTGKSTLLMTLPGRKLVYAFDPNAIDSYPPADDWDILHFFPSASELDISVSTLHGVKDASKHDSTRRHSKSKVEPVSYVNFEEDFTTRAESGWFRDNNYDWILFDSNTTFADICLDRVMYLNGRMGKHPEQADHTALMTLQRNIYRAAIGTGLHIAITMHTEFEKDENTHRTGQTLMTTGRNKIRIPLLFSQIYCTERDTIDGHIKYSIHTVGGKHNNFCRTNIKGLDPLTDVTIDFDSPLSGQGIGASVIPE